MSTPERTAPEPKLVRRLREMRADHKRHGPVYRGAFVVAGVALTVAGVAMLLLPGPAFVVIPIGLAILSLEFAWAGRLLDRSLVKAKAAQRKAASTTPRQRVLTAVGVGCAGGALVAWGALGNIPLLPV